MNEIVINIISVAVTAVVLPLISLLGAKLTQWLSAKVKDEKASSFLTKATDIVFSAVRSVFQTYVDTLKKQGSFDADAQKEALSRAKQIVEGQLSGELAEYIKANYGDLDSWITTQIEAAINSLKNA